VNSLKEGKNKINLEINNINIYTNSNSDLLKNSQKNKNHSINNYRYIIQKMKIIFTILKNHA